MDHDYIEITLRRYGFGLKLIKWFRTLYNDTSSRVLINGHLSRKVSVKRGFKQGDAFSNGLFDIAIDPLIRNINKKLSSSIILSLCLGLAWSDCLKGQRI